MTRNSWRRTAFTSISGNVEIAPDDWTLLDPSGEPLARLYKILGRPQDGQWYWSVLFRPDGSVAALMHNITNITPLNQRTKAH